MRIAFVSVPGFPCAVEVLRKPDLRDGPLIVSDDGRPQRVLDYSIADNTRRIRHGMTIRQAVGLCPGAAIVPPDPVLYRSLWDAATQAFGDFTPEVEDEELGRAYLNVSGLQSHYRDEHAMGEQIIAAVRQATGLTAAVGIATGKLPAFAIAATAGAGDTRVVPPGEEAASLASTTVGLLPFDPEVISRLRLLGLEQIGDVARFSVPELQSQFGFEGERLWQLANGIDTTILVPRPRSEALSAGFSFEAPVAGIDVMIAVARQLLSRLRPSLAGRAARKLVLQAELSSGRGWEHQIVLREAVSEEQRLLFVLRSALNNAPPPQAIRNLNLKLDALTYEVGKQLTLGEHSRLQLQLEETIRQLKTRYGYSPVYRCVEVEPWSVVPEQRWLLVESDT